MNAFVLYLLTLVSVVLSRPNLRIVGGSDVSKPFKYPFMVSILKNDVHICGGTLYHGNMVITAAHCSPKSGQVHLHSAETHRHNLELFYKEEGGMKHQVESVYTNSKFDLTTGAHDIAVWELDAPFNKEAGIELDDGSISNQTEFPLKFIGWGITDTKEVATILQEVVLPIIDFDKCNKKYNNTLIKQAQFCTMDNEQKKDACQGDSGGPAFVKRGNKFILVGVTSFGETCGHSEFPGVQTRVSSYKGFIDGIVNMTNKNKTGV
ncbi:putative trypsin-like serine protease precursor [Neoconidiobolus thromboides FSU 785]|nr:putative trypsin-like serine protease precursor [Neoconidiobolus thromboides FSU 785]